MKNHSNCDMIKGNELDVKGIVFDSHNSVSGYPIVMEFASKCSSARTWCKNLKIKYLRHATQTLIVSQFSKFNDLYKL